MRQFFVYIGCCARISGYPPRLIITTTPMAATLSTKQAVINIVSRERIRRWFICLILLCKVDGVERVIIIGMNFQGVGPEIDGFLFASQAV